MITIKRAENGWILEGEELGVQLFAYDEDVEGTKEQAAAFLLKSVERELGLEDSRYSKHRIYIEIRPGDKYEGK